MANTISVGNSNQSFTLSNPSWYSFGGSYVFSTVEQGTNELFTLPGVLSLLTWIVQSNSNSATVVHIRVATANGSETFNIGASATGTFQDSTHTDTITAGQEVDVEITGGTAAWTSGPLEILFSDNASTSSKQTAFGAPTYSTASVTRFIPMGGYDDGPTTTEANVQAKLLFVGTVKNMFVNVFQNTSTNTITMNSRQNTANGALTIAIAGNSGAGTHSDTTHTDTIAVNDLYNGSYVFGASTVSFISNLTGFDFISAAGVGQLTQYGSLNGQTIGVAKSVTTFFSIGGEMLTSTTESAWSGNALAAFTFQGLLINSTANTVSATSTLTVMEATIATTIVATITASTPGAYSDTTHTFVATGSTLMDLKLVTGGTGTTLTISGMSVWTKLAVAIITANPMFFTTKPDIRQLNPMFAKAPVMFAT